MNLLKTNLKNNTLDCKRMRKIMKTHFDVFEKWCVNIFNIVAEAYYNEKLFRMM